jgi:1-acyl-sn-glycerol-3-phosphate acyltransferase
MTSTPRSPAGKLRRRLVSIPALFGACVILTFTIPLWLPIAVLADMVRWKRRFPLARLLSFALCWSWIEIAGVLLSAWLWCTGRASNEAANYRLMGWWSAALMNALRHTIGVDPRIEGIEAVQSGQAIVLCRHASLADSLLSGWVFSAVAGVGPRYVLKRELLFDPCLDIVGQRVPNHFLDRGAADTSGELESLRQLGSTVGPGSVGVIFAEGTRANDVKRRRALDKIGERDPERARRLNVLSRLLPPRPAGSKAMLEGAPDADVVLAWHTGFDGLDTFAGMIERLSEPLPQVHFVMHRIRRSDVPDGDAFAEWLDDRWIEMDAQVDRALASR